MSPGASFSASACTSWLIGQSLADEALKHPVGPLQIVTAERHAVAVAEIELCQIAVQVFLFAVLIDAAHAAFEDGKEALNRIRVDEAPAILTGTVIDAAVGRELVLQLPIDRVFVRHDARFTGDVLADNRQNVVGRNVVDFHRAGAARATVTRLRIFILCA